MALRQTHVTSRRATARRSARSGGARASTRSSSPRSSAISPSYLNLIENNRRPLPATLLIRLAQLFNVDVHSFATDEDARLVADLIEAFADPLFEERDLTSVDVREMAAASPVAARAVLVALPRVPGARGSSADDLVVAPHRRRGDDRRRSIAPPERGGRRPDPAPLEPLPRARGRRRGARARRRSSRATTSTPASCATSRSSSAIQVQIARVGRGARRAAPLRSRAEGAHRSPSCFPTRSRTFQLAHQIGLITQQRRDRPHRARPAPHDRRVARALARSRSRTTSPARCSCRTAPFLQAAKEERYDIDVLGRRFRVGFEQVCHRLTTLRRPGAEGVPFHMIRIDVAGNISKRFSASGIRFARFSGACPRWNVFSAFLTPGMIRIQVSRMPDGLMYFCIARTIQKDSRRLPRAASRAGHRPRLPGRAREGARLLRRHRPRRTRTRACPSASPAASASASTASSARSRRSRHRSSVDENVRGSSLYSLPARS